MPHRWKQTIVINEEIAQHLIQTQQGLTVKSISQLDEGWDNIAYLVNGSIIFRFPRRELGLSCMTNEINLLPFIQKQVSFPLSAPQWIGKPTESYPYPYAGYPLVSGVSLTDACEHLIDNKIFAQTLASWLKELHNIPVTEPHASLLSEDLNWRLFTEHRVSRFDEFLPQYIHHYEAAGLTEKTLRESVDKLKNLQFPLFRKSFLHGDLYHRHIIVDPATLLPNGLIDWGDLHIGHPAIDLEAGLVCTAPVFEYFLHEYGKIDQEGINVLLFNAFFSAMSFLPYAFEQDKASLKRWAVLTAQRALEEMQHRMP